MMRHAVLPFAGCFLGMGLMLHADAADLAQTNAVPAPAHIRIVYEVRLGQIPVGQAESRWRREAQRFELNTTLQPVLGPRLHYRSEGQIIGHRLRPDHYQEFRGQKDKLRREILFDWTAATLRFRQGDDVTSQTLEPDTIDVHSLPFQIGWQNTGGQLPVAAGRHVRPQAFSLRRDGAELSLQGQRYRLNVWRSDAEQDSTEIWTAPQLHQLPLAIMRQFDAGPLHLIAQTVEIQP